MELRQKMKKDFIISEIKRTTIENRGIPLGQKRFESSSGIKESDWLGKYWVRWSEAVKAAGHVPNKMNGARSEKELLLPLVLKIRQLEHFPTQPELRLMRRNDPTFPSYSSIRNRWSTKSKLAKVVKEFCMQQKEFKDVIEICTPLVNNDTSSSQHTKTTAGMVYMLKHDNAYKIGKSIDPTRRYKEIRTQMPHSMEEIHTIATDDPSGIEAYWHNRFKDKRLKGEWFKLSTEDIRAFKRRKFM
jgi:hypothetical protein